jgi:branched-chain amino acid transport system ATP-binding protein
MLVVEDLHVRYGTTHAVRGVSFSVGAGEAVALLGPNGAGKTSTLKAISRIAASSGRVVFDGQDLAHVAPERVARAGVIHVPEGRQIFPDLTVHENLLLGMTARGGRSGFSLDDAYDLLPAMRTLRDRLGFALSGGEQQMVAIGRALVAAPRILLVDEPSLGLAPVVADTVADALAEIRTRVPVLVVEQNVHLALRVCTRAIVLAGGTVMLESPASELQDSDALLASYLGQSHTGTGA